MTPEGHEHEDTASETSGPQSEVRRWWGGAKQRSGRTGQGAIQIYGDPHGTWPRTGRPAAAPTGHQIICVISSRVMSSVCVVHRNVTSCVDLESGSEGSENKPSMSRNMCCWSDQASHPNRNKILTCCVTACWWSRASHLLLAERPRCHWAGAWRTRQNEPSNQL